jgi:nicotinamide-nucleotide adenylyltransferase
MRALFVGRFQPFHNGHLQVIKDILAENDFVTIAIGSSQEKDTEKNPFSFERRKEMIESALESEGIKNFEIISVPDFLDDEKWTADVMQKTKFDVVYSGNPWTVRCFKAKGIPVKSHKIYNREELSGTNIRERMIKGRPWSSLVPKTVLNFLKKLKS